MNGEVLILEQEYDASPEMLWRALTEPELMKKWYFDVQGFKAEVGCKFQFEGGEKEKRYTHLCEVLEVIPHKRLKHSWTYEGYSGYSYVTFELSSKGDKTLLKLSHYGLESFTDPDFIRENFVGGWKYLLQESLMEFLLNGKSLRTW